MALPGSLKSDAFALYLADLSIEEITRQIAPTALALGHRPPNPSTVMLWKKKKQGSAGRDWDEALREQREKSAAEIQRRLEKQRITLGERHFSDLEDMRKLLARSLRAVDPERSRGSSKVLMPREDLTPRDLRDAAAAFKDIQTCQRTIFGQEAYRVGVEATSPDGSSPGLPVPMIYLPAELPLPGAQDEPPASDDPEAE